MRPSARHRFTNVAQSALIIVGMGALLWFSTATLLGTGTALLLVGAAVVGILFAPQMPKQILLSAYKARRIEGDFPAGAAMVAELARRAELPRAPALYYIPSATPNAFALGSPQDSAVCITDGLIRTMGPRELAGVLAHEMSHIANRDLWIMGVADVMARVVSAAAWIGQVIFILYLPGLLFGIPGLNWALPLVLIFSPTVMALLQLALSRSREFDADLGAATLTGDPAGLASALVKLDRRVGRIWEEIFLPGRRIPEPSLLRTHPPTEERVARLSEISAEYRPIRADEGPAFDHPVVAEPPRFRRLGHFW